MNMPISLSSSRPQASGQRGLTLVELMIAMLLGLIILGAVVSVFLANRVSYNAGENLGRVQENARLAFDLMARDIREAGGSGCGENLTEVNVLNGANATWWMTYAGGSAYGVVAFDNAVAYPFRGFGVGERDRAAGTDAIHMSYAAGQGSVVTGHDFAGQMLTLDANVDGLRLGELAAVCDFARYSIFRIAGVFGAGDTDLSHTDIPPVGGPVSPTGEVPPENASADIGTYAVNAALYRYNSVGWYVGCNGRVPCGQPGGRSLFRVALQNSAPVADELIEGVDDMQLEFMVQGANQYVAPAAVVNWATVTAVRITLDLVGPDAGVTTGAAADRLTRRVTQTVAIRNRVS